MALCLGVTLNALVHGCADSERPAAPRITAVEDASGDGIAVIGETVTLQGENLDSEHLTVTVDAVDAPISDRGADRLVIRVPARVRSGTVPLVVSARGNDPVTASLKVRRLAYAANFTDGTLAVLDVAGLADPPVTLLGEIAVAVAPGPFEVAFTADGRTAVVTCSVAFLPAEIIAALAPGAPPGENVALVDTALGTVRSVIATGTASKPTGIAISPDGKLAFVSNYATSVISVIDIDAGALVGAIPVPRQPEELALSADGSLLLVASDGGTVSTIDPVARQVIATIETGGDDPSGVALSPDGRMGYVTNSFTDPSAGDDGTLTVLDLADRTSPRILATLTDQIGPTPYDVLLSPDGGTALVTNQNVRFAPVAIGPGSVTLLDLNVTPPRADVLPVGTAPINAAFSPDGALALVGNGLDRSVSVIDVVARRVDSTLTLPTTIGPADVAIQP